MSGYSGRCTSFNNWLRVAKKQAYQSLLILLACLASNVNAAQSSKILVVTSDNTVYRYGKIAKEFASALQQNNYQWSEVDLSRVNESELRSVVQQQNPEIIYCIGSQACSLARIFTHDKKLLFSAAPNWKKMDIGKGIYGIANGLAHTQELALLHYFFPGIKNIGILYNDDASRDYLETIKKGAAELGINIIARSVSNSKDVYDTLNELLPVIDMFWLISDPVVLSNTSTVQRIFQLAHHHAKPVYAYSDTYIPQGAVIAISADIASMGRQAAGLVMMLDQGFEPSAAVQNPAGSVITLNKCVLEVLPVGFNREAMGLINKIVECEDMDVNGYP